MKPIWMRLILVMGLFLFALSCSPLTISAHGNKQGIPKGKESVTELQNRGLEALYARQYQEARRFFIEAYKSNPHNPETLFYLGVTMELLHKPILAFQIYARFVTFSSESYYQQLMKGRYHWLARAVMEEHYRKATMSPSMPREETTPAQVVVLPFYIHNDSKQWQGLGRGVTDLITRHLAHINRLQVVSGIEQQALFRALSLSEASPASRVIVNRVQKALAGSMVIVGNIQNVNGTHFVLRASVLKPNAKKFHIVKVEGELTEFFTLQRQLVLQLLKQMDIRLTIHEREQLQFTPTTVVEAFRLFGNGLLAEDNLDYAPAINYYQQALALDAHFEIARNRLAYVKIMDVVSGPPSNILPRITGINLSALLPPPFSNSN